jgi:hypothetical protein
MAAGAAADAAAEPVPIRRPTAAKRRSQEAYERRQACYAEAARLRALGWSRRRIAVVIGAERKTRMLSRAGLRHRGAQPAPKPAADPMRFVATGASLARRLPQRSASLAGTGGTGFSGRPSIIRRWAGRRRKAEPRTAAPAKGTRPPNGTYSDLPWREQRIVLLLRAPCKAGSRRASLQAKAGIDSIETLGDRPDPRSPGG